jgi:hypothetical protein
MANKIQQYLENLERTYSALREELGETRFHEFLEYNTAMILQATGIGHGADVATSGETAALNLLLHKGKKTLCIFDVGANQGQFSALALGKLASNPVTLHCFEPSRAAFAILNQRFTSDQRVILNNIAISDEVG